MGRMHCSNYWPAVSALNVHDPEPYNKLRCSVLANFKIHNMKRILMLFIFCIANMPMVSAKNTQTSIKLYPVKVNGKWGFINKKGKLIVPPHYEDVDKIYGFCEDMSGVKENGKWGFINYKGTEVIKPVFDNIEPFYQGLAGFIVKPTGPNEMGDKKGFINKSGRVVIKEIYDPEFGLYGHFIEGACIVKKDFLYGYINHAGTSITNIEYISATGYDGGVASVQDKDSVFWMIDKSGKKISDGYRAMTNFSNGFASVTQKDGQKGILSKNGIFTNTGSYNVYTFFSFNCDNNVFIVTNDNKYGLMDTKGKHETEVKYNALTVFSEGLIAANYNGTVIDKDYGVIQNGWGYLDNKGKTAIPFQFQNITYFSDGLSAAEKDGKWGYIDKKGNWVIMPAFDKTPAEFINGLARVVVGDEYTAAGKYGYIDKTGKYVWEPQN
jgi:hypothetical protein